MTSSTTRNESQNRDAGNLPAAPAIRVLCVDDDEQARAVLSELLQSRGYLVETAIDADGALALLRSGTFDLVVLDSVSSIEHSTSTRGLRHFMVGLASLLRERGRSALLTETVLPNEPEPNAAYLFTIPDAICSLDYDESKDDLDRTIRVLKMRGSRHSTERRRLSIGEGGLQVERIALVRSSKAGADPEPRG